MGSFRVIYILCWPPISIAEIERKKKLIGSMLVMWMLRTTQHQFYGGVLLLPAPGLLSLQYIDL